MTDVALTGRFAPSPTGPLHFGSLLTAIASYCDARARQGRWLLRIEDTDIPRIQPGAESEILRALHAFGFEWDGEMVRQRDRLALYEAALQQLKTRQLVYACACSRKQLEGYSHYPNLCRHKQLDFAGQAVRLKVEDRSICFDDALQGTCFENLIHSTGDFVLKRRDGIISYQLAVVIDDAAQGITHVVRGADLLDNTVRQIWLGQCLGLPALHYCHLPLAMNDKGQKLSKQNLAVALDTSQAPQLIQAALQALHQPAVIPDSPQRMLAQAVAQWDLQRIPKQMQIEGVFA
jgi:glutamyl-Q tRNA(Asp) synthetase